MTPPSAAKQICSFSSHKMQLITFRDIGIIFFIFISFFDEIHKSKQNSPRKGHRVLRRHIGGYSVCLCPIKRTPGLYGLILVPSVPETAVVVDCGFPLTFVLNHLTNKVVLVIIYVYCHI